MTIPFFRSGRNGAALMLVFVLAAAGCTESDDGLMVGTLERDRHELKVESNEPILAIHVEDGQPVEAGQLILEQDPAREQARLAQQKALRDQVAARLAELRRGPRGESIREAQARLDVTAVRKINADADLVRVQDVFNRGLSNQSDLDDASTAAQTAAAEQRAAREALASLLNGTTIEELQQAEATLAAAEASVRQADIDLDRLRITAPVDGMMERVLFKTGERPPAGSTVSVVLASQRIYARVYVPEHLRASVQPDERLEVRVDGVERTFTGIVRWVSSDASFTPYFALTEHDRSRLTYLAEVDITDASHLPSGVPLEARLTGTGE